MLSDGREVAWTCPRCKGVYVVLKDVFRDGDHVCDDLKPKTCYYFYRLSDDNFIREFCVAGATDPNQSMETKTSDGQVQVWECREEGDLQVFKAPDGYDGGPVGWKYDRRRQRGRPMPRQLLERYALNNQHSA